MCRCFVGPWGEPDRYRLVEARSEGGEGTVWRGSLSLEGLEVAVAVKVISSVNAGDLEVWRGRWERQAELMRTLDHADSVSVRERRWPVG